MRFRVGQKVKVKSVKSGGNFSPGDIVEIIQIGDDDGYDMECYGAISPWDGYKWYLVEDEVGPVTNGDNLKAMSNEELADFIFGIRDDDDYCGKVIGGCYFPACNVDDIIEWLQRELKEK